MRWIIYLTLFVSVGILNAQLNEYDYTTSLNMPPSIDLAVINIRVEVLQGPSYYFYPPGTSFNNITGDVWVKILNAGTIPIPPDTMDPNPTYPVIYLKVNNLSYSYLYQKVIYGGQVDSVKFSNVSFTGLNDIIAYHNYLDDYAPNDTMKLLYSTYKADTILNYATTTIASMASGYSGNVGNAHIAVKYDSLKIWPFIENVDSYYITKVLFYHCTQWLNPPDCPSGNTRVSIWKDDGTGKPDLNQEIIGKDTFIQGRGLYVINLPQVINLQQSMLPFYVGRSWNSWNQNAAAFPFAEDIIRFPGYSNWKRADSILGGNWYHDASNTSLILAIVVQKKSSRTEEIILPSEAKLFKSEFIRDGRIEFISPIEKDTRLRIYSLDGTLIRDIKLSKGTKIVNVGKLNSGIYVYIVENRKGKIFVK